MANRITEGEQWTKVAVPIGRGAEGWAIMDGIVTVAVVYSDEETDQIIAAHNARQDAREALRIGVVRMGILIGRMRGCNEEAREQGRKPTHELLEEAESFQDEMVQALAALHPPVSGDVNWGDMDWEPASGGQA